MVQNKHLLTIALSAGIATLLLLFAIHFPSTIVYADETEVTDCATGESAVVNSGERMNTNDGVISNNEGTIVNNNNIVRENESSGTIINNNGAVYSNAGRIEYNNASGSVIGDTGSIGVNDGGSVTVDMATLGCTDNTTVTIENYYSGTLTNEWSNKSLNIVNNYSSTAYDNNDSNITDKNRFHSVTITDADHATTTYDNFILNNYDNKQYVQVKNNGEAAPITGTFTLKANNGYKITDGGTMINETGVMAYTLNRNNDGSYTVTLQNLNGNISITPADLHLIISAIAANQPNIKINDVVNIASNPNSNADSGTVAVDYTKLTLDALSSQMAASKQLESGIEVVDLYFDKKIDMTPALIKFLCENIPLAKRCHFTYKDQHWILFIPAFDLNAPAYATGLQALDREPAHTAGFLRIEQLFRPLGFATKTVDKTELENIQTVN